LDFQLPRPASACSPPILSASLNLFVFASPPRASCDSSPIVLFPLRAFASPCSALPLLNLPAAWITCLQWKLWARRTSPPVAQSPRRSVPLHAWPESSVPMFGEGQCFSPSSLSQAPSFDSRAGFWADINTQTTPGIFHQLGGLPTPRPGLCCHTFLQLPL